MPWIHCENASSMCPGLVVAVVAHPLAAPRDAALGTERDGVRRQPGPVDDVLTGRDEPVVAGDRLVRGLLVARHGERGLRRRHHERVAVVGAEVEHAAGGDQVHDLLLAAERPDREAAADRLGERDEIGLDPEVAGGPAEAGGDARS